VTQTQEPKTRQRIERYDAPSIEPRWQQRWNEIGLYRTDLSDRSKPLSYILTMYPYPSGDLHIGHWYIVTPTDAYARFRRMHGENVFFPIGFDAFGLPAENAAIKDGFSATGRCRTSSTSAASFGRWARCSTGTPRS
jgi:leucyl-tRNA synthetase